MRTRPWYRVWPEYLAMLFSLGWVPFLPRSGVVFLARISSAVAFRFARRLREVGLENLGLAFGDDLDAESKRRLLRKTFRHFALLGLDVIWFTRHPQERMRKWIRWDDSTQPMFEDEAQLLLTAHFGNWETVGQAYAAAGQRILSVAAPVKNPPVDRLFVALRQRTGQTIIPQQGAARKLLQGLRDHAKMAVLLDQNTRPRDGGIFVKFFGLPVPVSSVPAALAVRTHARVLAVTGVPDEIGRYTVRVHADLQPQSDAGDPVADLTQRMTAAMETVIRERPEYWCWMYKRWRFVPDHADRSRYPSYARALRHDELRKA
jgi:Kdo2-lipid IVA lauroyltransferase/acyltransferase